MDAFYFLKSRTEFIRFFYAEGSKGFADVKYQIENGMPPFDDPPNSEDCEPPYLSEWMDADTAREVLGIACISMLSDSLKLYFSTLEERGIRFSFENRTAAFRNGFVPAYFAALGEILDTDWSDCPVDRDLIEQVVLARNRGQHGEDITTFDVRYDAATIKKHPRPFFIGDDEMSVCTSEQGSLASLLMPNIKVSAEGLTEALNEVDALAEWIEARMERAGDCYQNQRSAGAASSRSETL
tara:strand:+ start:7323 stop:8042 length:720 start_codon:yes stop_codon:yes gene_type:complete